MAPPKIFQGCVITLGTSIPISDKSRLNSLVRKHGGTISAFLNDNTTHYLTHHWDKKCFQSNPQIHQILHISFLTDSVEQLQRCNEQDYILLPNNSPTEQALVLSALQKAYKNITAVNHGIHELENERLLTNLRNNEVKASAAVNQSLLRIQQIKLEREQRKEELEKPVEVASIELPSFEYQLLGNREEIQFHGFESDESDSFGFGLFGTDSADVSCDDSSVAESEDRESQNNSWIDTLNYTIRETEAEERERHRREEKQLKASRKAEEMQRKENLRRCKKEQVLKKMKQNAEEGKYQQRLKNQSRQKAAEEAREKLLQKKAALNEAWEAEQRRRRLEWEKKKKELRRDRKERKQRFKAQKDRILREEQEELGRKIFVGKATFSDIISDDSFNEFLKEELIDGRKEEFTKIFEKYGVIDTIKPNWDKNYFFVVYNEAADAQKAFNALTPFEERKKIASALRKQFKKSAKNIKLAPLPTFYVRWPK